MAAVRLRPLLLPVEHGGWGFLVEPVIIGLVAAPSMSGAWLTLVATAAFLSRQPLKVAMDDWQHGRRVPRTRVAWAGAAGYLMVATAALAAAAATSRAPFLALTAPVAPLAVLTLWFDRRGESRRLLPELAGATALGAVAGACARAAGWPWAPSLAVWMSALVLVLPAIVTVRERVNRLKGCQPAIAGPVAAHGLALLCTTSLASLRVMPPGIVFAALVLAVRAAHDLRPGTPTVPAMHIGIRELVTGLVAAGAMGVAWATMVSR